MNIGSGVLQVGDHATGNTHDVCRCCTEVVIPRPCSSPHFVVLQQVRINEHAQLCGVTEGGHATDCVAVGFETANRPVRYRPQATAMASIT